LCSAILVIREWDKYLRERIFVTALLFGFIVYWSLEFGGFGNELEGEGM